MVKVTAAAAAQIKESARQSKSEGMALRVAAKVDKDGVFHYAMGFDNANDHEDIAIDREGVQIIFAIPQQDLLKNMTIDYVELEEGESNFIFLNPNDPAFVPPQE